MAYLLVAPEVTIFIVFDSLLHYHISIITHFLAPDLFINRPSNDRNTVLLICINITYFFKYTISHGGNTATKKAFMATWLYLC